MMTFVVEGLRKHPRSGLPRPEGRASHDLSDHHHRRRPRVPPSSGRCGRRTIRQDREGLRRGRPPAPRLPRGERDACRRGQDQARARGDVHSEPARALGTGDSEEPLPRDDDLRRLLKRATARATRTVATTPSCGCSSTPGCGAPNWRTCGSKTSTSIPAWPSWWARAPALVSVALRGLHLWQWSACRPRERWRRLLPDLRRVLAAGVVATRHHVRHPGRPFGAARLTPACQGALLQARRRTSWRPRRMLRRTSPRRELFRRPPGRLRDGRRHTDGPHP